ncbi:PhoD-like phosphatase-domain-containing protein [Chaetomium fimeti]|uniref:PhoD-like phosphatase-domain-containing protein n=1 Tax=Chaetomium fimeti TaxID=1854472 RepID=A0AAE0LTC1_9PEZI|nr:PhoD-like phosphatase-domain-containing protein [Chaetomium fimeti]
MAIMQTKVATAASIGLRALSYIFLRWSQALVPEIAPAIIFTLFAIYLPAFVSSYRNEAKYDLVDEVDVVVTETAVEDEDVPESNNDRTTNGDREIIAEDVTVKETLSLEDRPVSAWKTLLSGAPNPRSLALSLATLLINGLCVGLVADRLFRERAYSAHDLSFVRLGYLSDTEAKLVIREPDQTKMPVSVEVHLKDPHPPFDNPLWQKAGGVKWTNNETDYTAVLSIPLRHSQKRTYEWRTSNNHSGEFTTPQPVGRAEETNDGPFTFLSTSCIVPRLPYSPFDHPLSIPGFKHLAKVLPTLNAQFMLFLGDFIYADVPRYWDKSASYYREKYRQIYASPDWPAVGQNLSWIHVIDDHEIANDWSANSTGVYQSAIDPFHHYQAAANPPLAKKVGSSKPRANTTYFEFTQGPASFFLLDTRTFRSPNNLPSGAAGKTMLGGDQLADFLSWLRRPEPKGVKWKIVASSVPFTKNWPVNKQDTWGGFLEERARVLEAMWDVADSGVGVVVLSGDRHEFAATKFPPPEDSYRWKETATVWEFSVSPLSQFYSPFGTYRQKDQEDVMVKYIHKGNSKFGAISIENLEGGDQSSLKYRLFIDGEETWNTVILSPPPLFGKSGGSFWASAWREALARAVEIMDKGLMVANLPAMWKIPESKERRNVLSSFWLRCVNQQTMQRNFDTFKVGSDGHKSTYPWEFIRHYMYHNERTDSLDPSLWGNEVHITPPAVNYRSRKDGFCFVEGTPYDNPEPTRELLERIAFIRQTHYGGFYDFKPDLAMADTAYTNQALSLHTDNTYFTDPAGLQAFHMLSHEPAKGESHATGGESVLLDGFNAARILKSENPEAYDILRSVGLPWHSSGNKGIKITTDLKYPVLEELPNGTLYRIRWNNDDRGVVPFSTISPERWYGAARKWHEIMERPEMQYWFQLKPGHVLIFDNWRVLHGRSAFKGIRRICGGYINRDDFMSQWANTNLSEEDNIHRVLG